MERKPAKPRVARRKPAKKTKAAKKKSETPTEEARRLRKLLVEALAILEDDVKYIDPFARRDARNLLRGRLTK